MKEDERRPLVLVSNDDGYGAPGIEAMVLALETWATVVVVAPAVDQSACSHKLSFRRPLPWREEARMRFSVHGTPADCVYLGILGGERVAPRVPDLVVSGLNLGCNLGVDVYYSGTVAAAREAAMRGVPGVAFSADPHTDMRRAASLCSDLAKCMLDVLQPRRPVVLNVNVPAHGSWEVCRTRLGRRRYGERVQYCREELGGEFLLLGDAKVVSNDLTPGTDTHAIDVGMVSVTGLPLTPSDEKDTERAVEAVVEAMRLGCGKVSER